MAHLYSDLSVKSLYSDRKYEGGKREWENRLETSTTLYIGNLSFYSTEEQLYEFFGTCGEGKRIVMGLDRHNKTRAQGDHKPETQYIGYSTTAYYFCEIQPTRPTPPPPEMKRRHVNL